MAVDADRIRVMLEYAKMLSEVGDHVQYDRVMTKVNIDLGMNIPRHVSPIGMYSIYDYSLSIDVPITAIEVMNNHTLNEVEREQRHIKLDIDHQTASLVELAEKHMHITKIVNEMKDIVGLYKHCNEHFEAAIFDYEMRKGT